MVTFVLMTKCWKKYICTQCSQHFHYMFTISLLHGYQTDDSHGTIQFLSYCQCWVNKKWLITISKQPGMQWINIRVTLNSLRHTSTQCYTAPMDIWHIAYNDFSKPQSILQPGFLFKLNSFDIVVACSLN